MADLGLAAPADLAAGALYVGEEGEVASVGEALATLGVAVERLNAADARRRQPGLGARFDQAVYVGGEGRLDPACVLSGLERAVLYGEGAVRCEALSCAVAHDFDAVVVAAGFESRGWCGRVPELAWLEPIKGHVLHYAGGVTSGPVVRSRAGYAAPQSAGTVFGATMEVGRSDNGLDAALVQQSERSWP